jgi:glyoxylase-like metal-dependent hydrolase (beta-lactamase superfamily II)
MRKPHRRQPAFAGAASFSSQKGACHSSRTSNTVNSIKAFLVLSLLVALLFFALPSHAQPGTTDYSKATTKTVKLRGNLTLLLITTPEDINKVLILDGPEGLLLVDHPEAVAAPIVKKTLDEFGGKTVKFLIDTHWHYDHVGGNEIYGPDAVIVAQENVLKRMSTAQTPFWTKTPIGPYPQKALPRITYKDSMAIHFDGEDIELDHYATGHTDGDSVVYFKNANVVHVADIYDGKGSLAGGADIVGIAKSLAAVRDRINDDTIIITGHSAGLSNRAELAQYVTLLDSTIDQVRADIAAGRGESEVVARGMPTAWRAWFPGDKLPIAADFLKSIYESLAHTNKVDQ